MPLQDVMINPEFTLLRYTWFEKFAVRGSGPDQTTLLRRDVRPGGLVHALSGNRHAAVPGLDMRLRPLMIWLAVLLHAAIGVLMGLNLFELLMMVMLLAFIPSYVIRERFKGRSNLPKFELVFNPATASAARAAALVAAVDGDGQVEFEPRSDEAAAVLMQHNKRWAGGEAARSLISGLRLTRLWRFFLWVPGIAGILTRLLFPDAEAKVARPKAGPRAPAAGS